MHGSGPGQLGSEASHLKILDSAAYYYALLLVRPGSAPGARSPRRERARAASEPSQIAFDLIFAGAVGVVTPNNPSSETTVDGSQAYQPSYSPTGEVLAYHKIVNKNHANNSLLMLVNRAQKTVESIDLGPAKLVDNAYIYDGIDPTWNRAARRSPTSATRATSTRFPTHQTPMNRPPTSAS